MQKKRIGRKGRGKRRERGGWGAREGARGRITIQLQRPPLLGPDFVLFSSCAKNQYLLLRMATFHDGATYVFVRCIYTPMTLLFSQPWRIWIASRFAHPRHWVLKSGTMEKQKLCDFRSTTRTTLSPICPSAKKLYHSSVHRQNQF